MKEMESKLFSAKRWTDIPAPIVIGHKESTPEEKKQHDKNAERIMREYGLLEKNETIKDGKIVKKEE